MKIVLTGDLHLGRTSTRLPVTWREQGRSIQAWQRLVDAVIAEKADLLLLSGDVVDSRNQLWEAMGPLQEGIQRLQAAGVRTLAVCGNHDASSLPNLATQMPSEAFMLLGENGSWQRETIKENGQAMLHIDGWSFPGQTVREDPTGKYPHHDSGDGVPVLAMVHGDPGVVDSVYAPLQMTRLQSLPVSAWLLGHIHRPQLTGGTPWILMPGSPHPLDPGEPGSHHAWITHLEAGALRSPVPFCPAALAYEEVCIEIQPEDPASIDGLSRKLQEQLQALPSAELRMLRIRLTGFSREINSLQECVLNLQDWAPSGIAVESVTLNVHPVLDLEEVAGAGPVPALLVEALKSTPPELEKRVQQLCETMTHQNEFSGKGLPPLNAEDLPLSSLLEKILRESLDQIS